MAPFFTSEPPFQVAPFCSAIAFKVVPFYSAECSGPAVYASTAARFLANRIRALWLRTHEAKRFSRREIAPQTLRQIALPGLAIDSGISIPSQPRRSLAAIAGYPIEELLRLRQTRSASIAEWCSCPGKRVRSTP